MYDCPHNLERGKMQEEIREKERKKERETERKKGIPKNKMLIIKLVHCREESLALGHNVWILLCSVCAP